MADRAGWLSVAPHAEAPGYAPSIVALLLAAVGARWSWPWCGAGRSAGSRRGPAWVAASPPPPAWLPFGDPATQYGGASFAQPLRRSLGAALLAAREVVDTPPPGDTRDGAARRRAQSDPADTLLFAPIRRLRERLSVEADRMQFLTIRRTLTVMFVAAGAVPRRGRAAGGEVSLFLALVTQSLHIALMLAAAPLLTGIVRWHQGAAARARRRVAVAAVARSGCGWRASSRCSPRTRPALFEAAPVVQIRGDRRRGAAGALLRARHGERAGRRPAGDRRAARLGALHTRPRRDGHRHRRSAASARAAR